MKKITIIDYGLSNLLSVRRAFAHFGAEVSITGDRAQIELADNLVLPGVGAFEDGMNGLRKLGLVETIRNKCASETPLLGICLGMQMLFDESFEFGRHAGLGLIPGRVEKIPNIDAAGNRQLVPNIGWNVLIPTDDERDLHDTVLRNFPQKGEVYFVHSFEAKPAKTKFNLAHTVYGDRDVCAVAVNEAGNAVGCQFHPEKSGEAGLAVIEAFLAQCV